MLPVDRVLGIDRMVCISRVNSIPQDQRAHNLLSTPSRASVFLRKANVVNEQVEKCLWLRHPMELHEETAIISLSSVFYFSNFSFGQCQGSLPELPSELTSQRCSSISQISLLF